MRSIALALVLAASLSACGENDTNTVENQPAPSAPTDVAVLPPAESDFNENVPATPTQVVNSTEPVAADGTIPAALRGRWGLTAADCTSTRGDAKGLITINADSIRFYESVAKPADVRSRSANEIRGDFAFSGEGQTWENPMVWTANGDKLTRIDSEPDSRLVYTRC